MVGATEEGEEEQQEQEQQEQQEQIGHHQLSVTTQSELKYFAAFTSSRFFRPS